MRQMGGTVISIHAPVKGATGEKIVRKKNAWDISIHAPVKGATAVPLGIAANEAIFQSTHP